MELLSRQMQINHPAATREPYHKETDAGIPCADPLAQTTRLTILHLEWHETLSLTSSSESNSTG